MGGSSKSIPVGLHLSLELRAAIGSLSCSNDSDLLHRDHAAVLSLQAGVGVLVPFATVSPPPTVLCRNSEPCAELHVGGIRNFDFALTRELSIQYQFLQPGLPHTTQYDFSLRGHLWPPLHYPQILTALSENS